MHCLSNAGVEKSLRPVARTPSRGSVKFYPLLLIVIVGSTGCGFNPTRLGIFLQLADDQKSIFIEVRARQND